MQITAWHLNQTLTVALLKNHAVADVRFGHNAHFICHPLRHEIRHTGLKAARIITSISNGATQHLSPDRSHISAGENVGPDYIDCLNRQLPRRPIATNQFNGSYLSNITGINHSHPFGTDGHRINVMFSDRVCNHYLIIDEVGRPQNGRAEAQRSGMHSAPNFTAK